MIRFLAFLPWENEPTRSICPHRIATLPVAAALLPLRLLLTCRLRLLAQLPPSSGQHLTLDSLVHVAEPPSSARSGAAKPLFSLLHATALAGCTCRTDIRLDWSTQGAVAPLCPPGIPPRRWALLPPRRWLSAVAKSLLLCRCWM